MSISTVCPGEIRMKNFRDTSLTVPVLILAIAFASSTTHGSGEERGIVSGLPGTYEASRILGNADEVAVTLFRPAPAEAAGTPIRYLVATYTDRKTTADDFERILPGNSGDNTWQIVLQSRNRIHWLSGSCPLGSDQFRSAYAGALEYVEGNDGQVQSANLCKCGSPCQRIMVDR